MSSARAFEPALLTGVLPDGRVVLADSSAYAIKLIGREGGLQSVLRRPITPRPVTGRRVGEDGPTDLITADGQYLGTIGADGMRIPDAFGPGAMVIDSQIS